MASNDLTLCEPEPTLDVEVTYIGKKSPFKFFSLNNNKRQVNCPFCGIKMIINGKGRLLCPNEHPFTMDTSMLDFMIVHKYFKPSPIEDLELAFPLCKKCNKVSMGVSSNQSYSTYGNVYFACECKYADRLILSISMDKIKAPSCPEILKKICDNNFELSRFVTINMGTANKAPLAPIKEAFDISKLTDL